jgi:hypothetical protein
MTDQDIKDYFVRLMVATKTFSAKDATGIVDMALQAGKRDFSNSHNWTFRQKSDTVTTTAAQETVDLPTDFDGMLSVRERTTTDGRKLIELPADEYDRQIPYSADLTNDTPKYYKAAYDVNSGIWQLFLYPTPNAAISLYITYLTSNVDNIPEKFLPALLSCIAKYIVLPGSKEHWSATNTANAEMARLIPMDTPSQSGISRMLEEEEATQPRSQRWWEDG